MSGKISTKLLIFILSLFMDISNALYQKSADENPIHASVSSVYSKQSNQVMPK